MSANEEYARALMRGNRRRQTYDYTSIEDRLHLKLGTLSDRIQHLKSSELEELEDRINWAVNLIDLFRRRNRSTEPPESPRMDEQAAGDGAGPREIAASAKHCEGFDGKSHNPLPLGTK